MRNITVTVHDDSYHAIRVWCAERDISISRLVQIFLEDLPRLKSVRRFPLPGAPDPRSLAAVFDQLDAQDLGTLRRRMRNFPSEIGL